MVDKIKLRLFYFAFIIIACFLNVNSLKAQVISSQVDTTVSTASNIGGGVDYNVVNNHVPQEYINGTSGRKYIVNRYSQFNLNINDVANVYIKTANASLNIVNGPMSNIQGIVNSLAGSPATPGSITGDFILVNPAGILIGSAGAINAGSIILSTSSVSNVPLGPGINSYANINDSSQDSRMFTQGISDSGVLKLSGPNSGISVLGSVNALNTRGIVMFGRYISITGSVNAPENGTVGLITAQDFEWDLATNSIFTNNPLTMDGAVWVDGSVNAPSGYIKIVSNTTDVNFNFINVAGLIDATAVSPSNDGGEVILVTQQPASGSVELDGAGPGVGAIVANSIGTGVGGTVVIDSSKIRIVNGGYIHARNSSINPIGGTVSLISNVLSSPTVLSSTGFIDPASIAAISTISTSHPSPAGELYIFDDHDHPNIDIIDSYTFPDATFVSIGSNAGNINQASSSSLIADKCIYLVGKDITTHGSIRSLGGDVKLFSSSGNINVGSLSTIESGPSSYVALLKALTNGSMVLNIDGEITSGAGNNPLYIGNMDSYLFAKDSITLAGSSFQGITGTYSSSANLNPINSKLRVSTVNLKLESASPPPKPPAPPSPEPEPSPEEDSNIVSEKEKEVKTIVEGINSDLVNYEENKDQADIDGFDQDVIDSSQMMSNFDDNSKIEDLDFNTLFFTCSGDNCDKYIDESAGSALVETLINGYPYENEFAADEKGLEFSYEAGYSPYGLQGFLETVEHLENMAKIMSAEEAHSAGSNLFSYKHPPSSERIAKVKSEIDSNNLINKDKKVNKRRYNKIIKIVD